MATKKSAKRHAKHRKVPTRGSEIAERRSRRRDDKIAETAEALRLALHGSGLEDVRPYIVALGECEASNPPDPVLMLAVEAAYELVELRDIGERFDRLWRLHRKAAAAYAKTRDARKVVRILSFVEREGRPSIDHVAALHLYLRLRRGGPIVGQRKKSLRGWRSRREAIEVVALEFGYKNPTRALEGLFEARRAARRAYKKYEESGKDSPSAVRAAAKARLPRRAEVRAWGDSVG